MKTEYMEDFPEVEGQEGLYCWNPDDKIDVTINIQAIKAYLKEKDPEAFEKLTLEEKLNLFTI